MKSLDMLEKTENGNISMSEKNVMRIMYLMIVNQVSNVRYYISKVIGVSTNSFYAKLKKIEEKYPDYYKYYLVNIENNKETMKENIKNILLYMGTLMNYGIELEDGSFRKFDMFDWFILRNKYLDNLNRTEISKILDELTKDSIVRDAKIDMFNLRRTISIGFGDCFNSYSSPVHRDYILNDRSKGLSEVESARLLKFMEENNIPLNLNNYDFGVSKMIQQRKTNNDLFELNIYQEYNNRKFVR